jgi:hypothetical protein
MDIPVVPMYGYLYIEEKCFIHGREVFEFRFIRWDYANSMVVISCECLKCEITAQDRGIKTRPKTQTKSFDNWVRFLDTIEWEMETLQQLEN